MIKYWSKLLVSSNCILKSCYEYMYDRVENYREVNWVSFIKQELLSLGFGEVWINQCTNKSHLEIIKQRIFDQAQQTIRAQIEASPKCILYKHLNDLFCIQYYLCKSLPLHLKKLIAKYRLSSHSLAIETGRYQATARNLRNCPKCNNDIEDEYHFVLKCPFYTDLRSKYVKPYYWKKPSVFKLVQLFSVRNVKQTYNLGQFLRHAGNLRIM